MVWTLLWDSPIYTLDCERDTDISNSQDANAFGQFCTPVTLPWARAAPCTSSRLRLAVISQRWRSLKEPQPPHPASVLRAPGAHTWPATPKTPTPRALREGKSKSQIDLNPDLQISFFYSEDLIPDPPKCLGCLLLNTSSNTTNALACPRTGCVP